MKASTLAAIVLIMMSAFGAPAVHATLVVEAFVTALPAGFSHFDVFVTDTGAEDAVIVSLVDAPPGDALIGPSLSAPAGFLAAYDPGLGIVDLIADSALTFPTGTTGPFSFDSMASGGAVFTMFEALTATGAFITGDISIVIVDPVPAPAPAMLLLGGALVVLGARLARKRLG